MEKDEFDENFWSFNKLDKILLNKVNVCDIIGVILSVWLGANVNQKPEYIWSLLIMAVYSESTEMIKILLRAGVNIDVQDSLGYTALYNSILIGDIEIVKFLIDSGAELFNLQRSISRIRPSNNAQEIFNLLSKYSPESYTVDDQNLYTLAHPLN